MNKKQSIQSLEREERLKQLGGFGNKPTQVVKDKTKYTRKTKHKMEDGHHD